MNCIHFAFTFQVTLFSREGLNSVARWTLLHNTHQFGLLRVEAPYKARDTAEEKRLWIVEYRQRIVDGYKAHTREDPVKEVKWNLNGIY